MRTAFADGESGEDVFLLVFLRVISLRFCGTLLWRQKRTPSRGCDDFALGFERVFAGFGHYDGLFENAVGIESADEP